MGKNNFIVLVALIVALGGFLMGFDASVISGVVKFIEPEFGLTKLQLGWSVGSLTLSATLAMLLAGPWSDKIGRRSVLKYAAALFAISAIGSALAPSFITLVIARMVGGVGVGLALIIAPMYIAEIAPPKMRGQMVSFNQLNIVLGISVAFFTNYLILQWSKSDAAWATSLGFDKWTWRWMLGLETLPAVLYFLGLFLVPRSPRWLCMKGKFDEAVEVMKRATAPAEAESQIESIRDAIQTGDKKEKGVLSRLFSKEMSLVLTIGLVIGILQQITGINSVFFYAPMIFEQSGIGTDASFIQAILVGLTNLVFTIAAILLIDRLGRKPLLLFGVTGIAVCMFLLAWSFNTATYSLTAETLTTLPAEINTESLQALVGQTFETDTEYKQAMAGILGDQATLYESELITAAIEMNATLVLIGILGFVASFAISLGPVMWVLFSELFPNTIRGVAISVVGLVNSAVSTLVQVVFPWELANFGSSLTFLIYGIFAAVGLVFIFFVVPETKGRSLEELEEMLVTSRK